jgi:Beta-propeller repeat
MLRLSRFATLLCSASMLAAAGRSVDSNAAAMAKARSAVAQLPLRFEANLGQLNPEVRYAARSGGFTLLLTGQGASLYVPGSRRVDVSLLNSNHAPELEPLDRVSARVDSYVGGRDRWRTNIPSFGRVRYHSVYPGIDVDYYGNEGRLEYDFVLSPGADPRSIRMKFSGAPSLSLDREGDLVLEVGGRRLVQKKPFIYQEDPRTSLRVQVAGGYRLLGKNTVGLRLGRYDRKQKLVIDPTLAYLTYFGGPGADQINAAKMDSKGRLYLAGQTDTGYIPYQDGAYNTVNAGGLDIFLSVFDTTHGGYDLVYSSYLGGAGDDVPLAIDVDSAGVAYLTGFSRSVDFPMVGATQTSPSASFLNAFVSKIDPSQYGSGSLVFSSYLNGTDGDTTGNGIAAGNDGRIYLIGTTKAGDFPATSSAFQAVRWGAQDAFVAKMDPGTGGIDYATYLGGEDLDDGRNILVGSNGLVYFACSTFSTEFPMAGFQFNSNASGGADVAVGVMDLNQQGAASLKYSTFFGGSGNEEVRAMTFDGAGDIVITGYTLSDNFPLTPDAIQRVNNGGGDAFVAILNPSLPFARGLLYSTYLGGKAGDVAYGLAVDPAGYIYVTGYTLSPDFPVAGIMPQGNWGGGTDIFVTKFKPGVAGTAAINFSTYLGASNIYVPSSINLGSDGRIYVAGRGGIGLPSSLYAIQYGYAGGSTDGFFFVLTPDPAAQSQSGTQQTQNALPPAARRRPAGRSSLNSLQHR